MKREFLEHLTKPTDLGYIGCYHPCSPLPVVIITARRCASTVWYMPSSYICLSVTLRDCIKTAKRRITQIMPHDRNFSFVLPTITAKFERGHPLRGRQMQVG